MNINEDDKKTTEKILQKNKSFKLYDYNVYDIDLNYNKKSNCYQDNKVFMIQAFGINSQGKTASIKIENFNPYFYIKVDDDWNDQRKNIFTANFLKKRIGNYYENSILETKLIKRQKLYGFDNKKLHNFIKISFRNQAAYNRMKKIFYIDETIDGVFERTLREEGIPYQDDIGLTQLFLYEADIPPVLKFFHDREISPSGWVLLPASKSRTNSKKSTHCYYDFNINFNDIIPLKKKEDLVKYNICSFDIEASSSHGDFPLAIKNYKKLAKNILENYHNRDEIYQNKYDKDQLKREIFTAFQFDSLDYIDQVYPKIKSYTLSQIENLYENLVRYQPASDNKSNKKDEFIEVEATFSDSDNDLDNDLNNDNNQQDNEVVSTFKKSVKIVKKYTKKNASILDVIKDDTCEYETKLNELTRAFHVTGFPELEGDCVTFIGCSFINYTESQPYYRVIIVKGGCQIPEKYLNWVQENNVIVIEKKTEREVLLTFTKLIKTENPHIITGYNITGFDFDFMVDRAKELKCLEEFLKLSRNKDEVCLKKDWKTGEEDIETNKIVLASGEYNLRFPKMPGRIIIDMCVIFRKEYTLSSNKLDYVSSYFISDSVKKIELNQEKQTTKIYSKNLTGINSGTFVKFEEIGFSNTSYKKGKKFEIIEIDREESSFIIDSYEELDLEKSKFNWGLAKDDVSPQEIFKLANGNDFDRWTVGKYCLADCDNVIWLLLKVDVITDKVEMSNLCDVPLSFLLLRGQGIKLQSFVSKKCGEKNTLMPVIKKTKTGAGYEGAHVFEPKTGVYLDDPVACVDYSSLYPSSIISENLSHDSKVWTKEFDLSGNLIETWGEINLNGEFKYDNLYDLGYTYVDVQYNTYRWVRPTPKAAAKKVVVGYKICRFAQFPEGRAIMPSILEELLGARKATRKLIPQQTDEFMKNVLDKRQLSIKTTANSLYGQTGAETSAFCEKDVAAATTATGRKLLFYGKAIIEQCYDDIVLTTSDGNQVRVKAECVYGDTDSVFFKFNLRDAKTGEKIVKRQALIYTIELAKQAGELASKFLKRPHDLEYEKTFWPWVILSKKRYVGVLYEEDPDKGKIKYMGIVLKRRDNADIVKDIYGGVVAILMKEMSIAKSIKFVDECLENMLQEKYPIEKLLITKSLRGYYKNPKQIAHKVLAERIGLRESGNKPSAGDRMYYGYIKNLDKKALQGDKIETPEFIKANNLPIDYGHYITNQIMKPLLQLFALELENISEFKKKRGITLQSWYSEVEKLKSKWPDYEKFEKKYEELRCKEVKSLIFDKYLKDLK
tara:strand:- start:579 stop:4454 length:3876 start_codon:yes stop_codon:yes gene_type:complete